MSKFLKNFLGDFVKGAMGKTNGYLRDQQHASRLYVDTNYGMAPKAGWSYFVEIGLNPKIGSNRKMFPAIDEAWYKNTKGKIGLVAKQVDLPRFTIGHETINQYNKKTVIQNKITYNPVSFTFHDDMDNMTTNLWKNYYQYYYSDSRYTGTYSGTLAGRTSSLPAAYSKTGFTQNRAYSYGLNNEQSEPFISFIRIFLLNRKKYTSMTLINPIITEWQHSQLDNTGSKMLENKMTVSYESVYYDTGNKKITKQTPGVSNVHYDTTPSPLSVFGGGGVGGLAGIFGGAADVLDIFSKDEPLSFGDVLGAAIGAKNVYNAVKSSTAASRKAELTGIISSTFVDAARGRGTFADSNGLKDLVNTPVNLNLFKSNVPLYNSDGSAIVPATTRTGLK